MTNWLQHLLQAWQLLMSRTLNVRCMRKDGSLLEAATWGVSGCAAAIALLDMPFILPSGARTASHSYESLPRSIDCCQQTSGCFEMQAGDMIDSAAAGENSRTLSHVARMTLGDCDRGNSR